MTQKKVVRVEHEKPSQPGGQTWKPTPEAKGQATTNRVIALILWALAIGGEAFAIFWILKQTPVNMVYLIGAIVIIGILALVGDLLWKNANKKDPASKADAVRFFFQNQFGAIMAMIAFIPLIVMIFLNKDMDKKQKGLAGGVGVVVFLIAAVMGVSFNPPSTEQYTQTAYPQYEEESALIIEYTGQDLVFWTKDGTVYHLCQDVSDLQRESKDNTIYSGTVAEAHAANKERLTLEVDSELEQCGYDVAPVETPVP